MKDESTLSNCQEPPKFIHGVVSSLLAVAASASLTSFTLGPSAPDLLTHLRATKVPLGA